MSKRHRTSDPLLRLVDAALLGIVLVAPHFMGGRYPIGRFVFVSLAALAAVSWCARELRDANRSWIRSPADWLVPAGMLLVVVQLIPWPTPALATLSPAVTARLPLWSPAAGSALPLGTWRQISLVPAATRGGLAIYLAYGMLFFVVVQRVRCVDDVARILSWIGLSAVLMAAVGLLQYLLSNGKFLWVYEHPFRTTSTQVTGSFINRNHFTHLLALGLGPVLLWVVASGSAANHRGRLRGVAPWPGSLLRGQGLAGQIALGVLIFAGLISLSRGGAVVMAVVLAVFGVVAFRAALLGKRQLLGGLGIGVLVAAALAIHGHDRVAHRLDDLRAGSLDRLDRGRGRRDVWAANLAVIADYPVLGTGVGSHAEVHPMYRRDSPDVEYTHAENGYLQIASETGCAGLLLLMAAIGMCVGWCVRTWHRTRSVSILACLAPVAAGLAASLVHSLVDFVWYIPACMSFAVILAACAARLWHFTRAGEPAAALAAALPRPFWAGLTGLTVVAGTWMVCDHLPPALASPAWDSYLRASLAGARLDQARVDGVADDHTASGLPRPATADAARSTEAMIADLQRVVTWYPAHARAHLRLAGACLERFDQLQRVSRNAMDLSQIRDAAIASRFRSRSELDGWLARAFGPDVTLLNKALWHARRGLRLCPLQGEGYLFLAELCFLEGSADAAKAAYLDQALRVRPNDERVHFAAGKDAALEGDLAAAMSHWKQCFHVGGAYQLQLIRLLAGQVPVSFFIDNFHPRLADLQLLHRQYRSLGRMQEMDGFCTYYVQAAAAAACDEEAPEAVQTWLSASRVCGDFGQVDTALACAKEAFRLDPDNYDAHFMTATLLVGAGKLEDADCHLRWCQLRKPNDGKLQSLVDLAIRRRATRRL